MRSAQAGRLLVGLIGGLLTGACSSGATVQGTVVDVFGAPVVGTTVVISSGSFSQTTITDARGLFTVSGVPSPYDATVIPSLGVGMPLAFVFAGLTRLDPTLPVDESTSALTQHNATLTGQFYGGQYPETPEYVTSFTFSSPQIAQGLLTQNPQEPGSGSYALSLIWEGPSPLVGTLYALQVHFGAVAGFPVDYPGFGTLSGITLEDGASLANQNVSLAPVSTGTLTGTINVPPDYTSLGASVSLLAAPGVLLSPVVTDRSQDASFSYVTPSIPGTSLILRAGAQRGGGVNISGISSAQMLVSATASNVVLAIPAAPTLLQPSATASVTVETPFSWTWPQNSGAVYMVVIGGPGLFFTVYTAATTLTIPDLADAGLALVPSASYLWEVYGLAPVGSVDQLATPNAFQSLRYGSYVQAMSNQQGFKASP
jgi:hypothetical protein